MEGSDTNAILQEKIMQLKWPGPVVISVMLTGCGPAGGTGIDQSTPRPASFAASATVANVHAALIIPGSDALFAAESNSPEGDAQWASLEAAAQKVIEGARHLQDPSRRRDDMEWARVAKALEDSAGKSLAAAAAQDIDTLPLANGDFVAQCEDCHTVYRDAGIGMMNNPDL